MGPETENVRAGTIEMSWDPGSRLAFIRFDANTNATGIEAKVLVEAITGWIGGEGKAFALLGDGGRLGKLDAEYRAIWGNFFKQHRGEAVIAFFNMSAVVRIAAEMFRIGTGLRLKAFSAEPEARAWLREMGISA